MICTTALTNPALDIICLPACVLDTQGSIVFANRAWRALTAECPALGEFALEGTGFAESPDAYFDAGAARVRLGPKVSPWLPSGMLMLDGVEHRLGGLGAIRSARIEESPTACDFLLPGIGRQSQTTSRHCLHGANLTCSRG